MKRGGRGDLLRGVLKREQIYHTDLFRRLFEERAGGEYEEGGGKIGVMNGVVVPLIHPHGFHYMPSFQLFPLPLSFLSSSGFPGMAGFSFDSDDARPS